MASWREEGEGGREGARDGEIKMIEKNYFETPRKPPPSSLPPSLPPYPRSDTSNGVL